ncbi:Dabb family protein [Albibacterium sp.]|uniref:Dabb family protein n=1 Tax=Albibacterium sp. TaxID=2952885 RepID=UPI002C5F2AF0|nr:Dabb family protein [Albibacterium sp.]HUH19217.1 Dabb family protein [Albibacterium sp.]
MQRRKFIKNVAGTAVLGGLLGTSIPSVLASTQKQDKMIVHYVLFWLREDLSPQEIKDFTGFFEELKKIPNIHTLQYGAPAQTNARGVVDNSFSYNLLVQFKTMHDIEVYETHPIHLAAIEKYSKNWTKVVVHDSVL